MKQPQTDLTVNVEREADVGVPGVLEEMYNPMSFRKNEKFYETTFLPKAVKRIKSMKMQKKYGNILRVKY